MKNRLDLLRTEGNKRVSSYGEYYIDVREPSSTFGKTTMIVAVFDALPGDFNIEDRKRWIFNIPLSIGHYTIGKNDSYFDILMYFPSFTTLNIIKGKYFVELLLADTQILGAFERLFEGIDYWKNLPTDSLGAFESFLSDHAPDIEIRLKLRMNYPIAFEDIEEARNVEIRERALRKFGYENYVKEGFKRGKINYIIIGDKIFQYHNPNSNFNKIPEGYFNNRDDKIIFLSDDITFLQVKDPSSGKIYFLKVPPDMHSVKEAKAWTFGLKKEEYNPEIET